MRHAGLDARISLERLQIGGGEDLVVRLDRPGTSRAPTLCVLYMHGFGSRQTGTKAAFFRQRFLRYRLDFCSFDFRGHGDSGGDLRDLTLSRNLEDIGRVQDELRQRGYRRFVLFGSSMGAFSGLWFAARRPDDVAAAVHIAPALQMEAGLLAWAGRDGVERWQRQGTIELRSELVDCELGWELIEDLRRYPLEELQAAYRTPTLLLQGKHDDSVPWRRVIDFATGCAFDGLEVHLMGDGDHRLVDRLPHLWALTRDFLEARDVV